VQPPQKLEFLPIPDFHPQGTTGRVPPFFPVRPLFAGTFRNLARVRQVRSPMRIKFVK
jgi:hypothetical protein